MPENKLDFKGFLFPTTTPVPDQLFDELLEHLTGAELKVLLYIVRRTFGFKKAHDDISLGQLVDGIRAKDGRVIDQGTGLAKSTVVAALKGLQEKNVIVARRNSSREKGYEPTTYALNVLEGPLSENRTRGSSKIEQGLVRKSNIQQTTLQQTVRHNVSSTRFPSLGKPRGKVDYLVREIEKVTRDTHSHRMFAVIADALPDHILFQLLSEIKQGEGIHNPGAIFVAAAKRWMERRRSRGGG